MQPFQQRLGDAARALDLVGRGSDLRPELAGTGDRVRTGLDVHASPQIGRPLRPQRVRTELPYPRYRHGGAPTAALSSMVHCGSASPGATSVNTMRTRVPMPTRSTSSFGASTPSGRTRLPITRSPSSLVGMPLWVSSSTSSTRYGVYCLKAG